MKELVVISGKGGTGKTSIVAALATLAGRKALADCDVDAADLHLVMQPEVRQREEFTAGRKASIRGGDCIRCGRCLEVCRYGAVRRSGIGGNSASRHGKAGGALFEIDPLACEGCGVCVEFCPAKAIDFQPRVSGEWYISETRHGPMVHARLGIAEENSGKLVTMVRKQAARLAAERSLNFVIIDGPPGIGCPVIASLAGTSLALIVTEPTVSGLHDMERVLQLAAHFKVPAMLCINKCDINPDMTDMLRRRAAELRMRVAGEIPYDTSVTRAQIAGRSIVEFDVGGSVAGEVNRMWRTVLEALESPSDG